MKFVIIFLTLFGFVNSTIAADERTPALVRKIQGIELLPNGIARQLERLSLQMVSKQKDYQLILSGVDAPTSSVIKMVAVESEISRAQRGYRIEARLLDLKSKKLLTKASHDDIREEDLVRLYQGALESLFIPDEKKPEAKASPEPAPKVKNPKTTSSEPQVRLPSPEAVDFRKRIQDMKMGVDDKIEKTVADEKAKEEEAKAKVAEANAAKAAAARETPMMATEMPMKKSAGPQYKKTFNISMAWESRDLLSEDLVETSSKAELMTLRLLGDHPLPVLAGRLAYSYNLSVSKTLSSAEPIPQPYELGLLGTWLGDKWKLSAGAHRDTSFIFNVPAPGAGLQTNMLTTLWSRVQGELTFGVDRPWRLGVAVGSPLSASSGSPSLEKADKWTGSNFRGSLAVPLFSHVWDTQVSIERINLSTEGVRPFTLNESRFALSVRRLL